MVGVPASQILFGCLVVLCFQGYWTSSPSRPDQSCNNGNCTLDLNCMVINLEYVDCNWTRPHKQPTSYIFKSTFNNHKVSQECPEYLKEHGQNVGCRIHLQEREYFSDLHTTLVMGVNQSFSKTFTEFKERVKLNPPNNFSVTWTPDGNLCLHWKPKGSCFEFVLRYWRGVDPKEKVSHLLKNSEYCESFVSEGVNFTFQVKSKMGPICGQSKYWSEWSNPVRWGNFTENKHVPSPGVQFWWLFGVLGFIVLIALAVLLLFCERIKVVLLPVIPDPSQNLQDLFHKHKGNVESWVHISRDLKEAFEPDYTETPCIVCEPSSTFEAKQADESTQQTS